MAPLLRVRPCFDDVGLCTTYALRSPPACPPRRILRTGDHLQNHTNKNQVGGAIRGASAGERLTSHRGIDTESSVLSGCRYPSQVRKNHRNGIKKPAANKYHTTKGVSNLLAMCIVHACTPHADRHASCALIMCLTLFAHALLSAADGPQVPPQPGAPSLRVAALFLARRAHRGTGSASKRAFGVL